jgi:hypothetical protein
MAGASEGHGPSPFASYSLTLNLKPAASDFAPFRAYTRYSISGASSPQATGKVE